MSYHEQIRNTSVTVTTSNYVLSEQVFPPNAQRKSISFVNTSTGGQNITLSIGEEAVAGKGFTIYPGGSYSESSDGISLCTNQQINLISSAAGGTVAVQERILVQRWDS